MMMLNTNFRFDQIKICIDTVLKNLKSSYFTLKIKRVFLCFVQGFIFLSVLLMASSIFT